MQGHPEFLQHHWLSVWCVFGPTAGVCCNCIALYPILVVILKLVWVGVFMACSCILQSMLCVCFLHQPTKLYLLLLLSLITSTARRLLCYSSSRSRAAYVLFPQQHSSLRLVSRSAHHTQTLSCVVCNDHARVHAYCQDGWPAGCAVK